MWILYLYLASCSWLMVGMLTSYWSSLLNPSLDKYQLRRMFITWPLVLVRAAIELSVNLIGKFK